MIKIILILATIVLCQSVLYSNFWAPIYNPRILNYRVDIDYDPNGGKISQEQFLRKHGYRGEKLIKDLGNGRGPSETGGNVHEDITFYYTYTGSKNL